jgi:hypothetical protein
MQIIEVTDLWVRSAVVRLRRRDMPLQFVVYPMVHMAQPSFYRAVTTRLRRADVVVAEGVRRGRGGSVLVNALTFSYRVTRFNRRAGVVEQDIDYAALGVELICPDVDSAELRVGWRRVPLAHRVMVWLALPVVVLMRLFGGTRQVWSQAMAQDDLPSSQEEDMAAAMPELDSAFLGERDERLLAALRRIHEERGGEPIEVAIVYGAAHVPQIVHGLVRIGYRPRSSEWLVIADV